MSKKICIKKVVDSTGYHFYPCANVAKYGDYCGVHSPEKRAERAAKRGPSKWERECAMRKEYREALDAVLREARVAAAIMQLGRLHDALAAFDEVTQRIPGRLQ